MGSGLHTCAGHAPATRVQATRGHTPATRVQAMRAAGEGAARAPRGADSATRVTHARPCGLHCRLSPGRRVGRAQFQAMWALPRDMLRSKLAAFQWTSEGRPPLPAQARPHLVAKFGLYLIEIFGQIPVGADFSPNQIRDVLFFGGAEAEFTILSVAYSE